MSDYFILLSAGKSKRFKSKLKKQFIIYKNKPLFEHSLQTAINSKLFKEILIVTNKKIKDYNNLKQVNGHLTKKLLTDRDILKYYHEAIATLIPLKNTLQPSGQSVFLQSLSSGTPVIISKFDGLFDDKFKNLENCIITDNTNFNEVIKEYLSLDLSLLSTISFNGRKTLQENFNLDKVYTEFENKILSI